MDIVTGHVGSAHVTSWQDRDLNQGIFGSGTYILGVGSKLAATIITNNEIDIADGVLVMQGCQGVIQKGTYQAMTIDNGSAGMKRIDLICAEYTKVGGVEDLDLVVVKGTPAASNPSQPSVTSGDIQNGDSPVQVPIYRVHINGLTIESVETWVPEKDIIPNTNALATDGTISAASGKTAISVTPYSAGTYLFSLTASAGENLPSLKCIIDTGDYAFTSGVGEYDSYSGKQKAGVTAFFTLDAMETIALYIYQSSGHSVSVDYRLTLKKVG